MTSHTRRNVLRGAAAITAAGGLVGAGAGSLPAAAAATPVKRRFPFLEGAFKPVTEELTAFDLPVTGRIPRELNGRYLRTGPNVLGLEDPRAHHWTNFDAPFFVAGRGSGGPYGAGTARLDRWTIDLRHGRVRTKTLDDRPQEFPRVNEALVSRRHRYGYSAASAEMTLAYLTADGNPPDRAFGNALFKHDLLRGTAQVHRLPRGSAASEAVFVPCDPADPGAAEDDGYAIAYVHDPDRGASDLVILSAQDFTGEPVARIHLPGRVPLGFHGSWVPDA
jgi:carotenoid cleavage dioxygenase-like enzyme